MKRLILLTTTMALVFGFALMAMAAHSDGGVDEAWTEAKNHESYWESRFTTAQFTVECTKFSLHSGFIPEEYEAAIVKDGNYLRVYANIGGAFTASGAVNPANGQHFAAPHSWVMKCNFYPVTTTTTEQETTTSTPSTTTTTSPTTTSSTGESTTTTAPGTTTTEPEGSSSTSSTSTSIAAPTTTVTIVPPVTDPSVPSTTVPTDTGSTLPHTGANSSNLVAMAIGLLILGGTALYEVKHWDDGELSSSR